MYIPTWMLITLIVAFLSGGIDGLFFGALVCAACYYWYISIPILIILFIIYLISLFITSLPKIKETFLETIQDIKKINIKKEIIDIFEDIKNIDYKKNLLVLMKVFINCLLCYIYLIVLMIPMIFISMIKNENINFILLLLYLVFAGFLIWFLYDKKSDKIFLTLKDKTK